MYKLIKGTSGGYISIAIIMTLIALASAYYFTIKSSQNNDLKNYAIIKKNMMVLNSAIALYYQNNGYLPCPADLTLKPNNSSFMSESKTGISCKTTAGVFASDDSLIYIGSAPTRALDMKLSYSQDSWDSKIIYAVTQCMTMSSSSYNSCTGGITIKDGSGNIIDGSAAYALISLGPDKMGAYGFQSSSMGATCVISNTEKNNCGYTNSTFIQTNPTFYYNVNNSSYYDDIVLYWDKLGG